MCGRFTQEYTWQEVFDYYNLTGPAMNLNPNWNVAPTQTVHMLVSDDQGLVLGEARWGLVPSWWKKSLKEVPATFNARSETVAEKPMFRNAFRHRRCLVPAGGFFEWPRSGKEKQPCFISRADGMPLTFAGLWESWVNPENGESVVSTTVLTTGANEFMEPIHNRMPVILERAHFDAWLEQGGTGLPGPCADDILSCVNVSKSVGNVRNNGPELVAPVSG